MDTILAGSPVVSNVGSLDAYNALTKAGWLAALIPQEYGGSGLGLTEATVIMEEINRCGGNSGACHGQMYTNFLESNVR